MDKEIFLGLGRLLQSYQTNEGNNSAVASTIVEVGNAVLHTINELQTSKAESQVLLDKLQEPETLKAVINKIQEPKIFKAVMEEIKEPQALKDKSGDWLQKIQEPETLKAVTDKLQEPQAVKTNIGAWLNKIQELQADCLDSERLCDKLQELETSNAESEALLNKIQELEKSNADSDALRDKLRELDTFNTKNNILRAEFEVLFQNIQDLKRSKADKADLEPSAFKICSEIASDPKLNEYHAALSDKLNSANSSAAVLTEDDFEISASVPVKIAAGAAAQIPVVGKVVSGAMTTATSVKKGNKVKTKAINLKLIHLNPITRLSILHQVAQRVTLARKHAIQNAEENEEVRLWRKKWKMLRKAKNSITVDMKGKIYQSDTEVLGYLDAKKILWAISKNKIDGEADEAMKIEQLAEISKKCTYTKSGIKLDE